jgi:hypothetical protein
MNIERIIVPVPETAKTAWQENLANAFDHNELAQNNENLEKEKSMLKIELATMAEQLDFLDDHDWDLLTIMKNFHQETYEHSLNTLIIAKEKTQLLLSDGLRLGDKIATEVGNLDTFYQACIFHDIGKTSIPLEILNNDINDTAWAKEFLALPIETQSAIFKENSLARPEDNEEIVRMLLTRDLRANKYVPLQYGLDTEQLAVMKEKNIRSDQTLMEVMNRHETESERILTSLGYGEAALLAGAHHGNRVNAEQLQDMPASLTSLRMSSTTASFAIHLADIQQALEGQRPYHGQIPMINILAVLAKQSRFNPLEHEIAIAWISDEFSKLDAATINDIRNKNGKLNSEKERTEQAENLRLVEDFLKYQLT